MIEDLLEHIGVEDIRSLGVEVQGRCPMHEKRTGERERRPDHWSINRHSGAHHCFSCEYSGSLTRLVMDVAKTNLWDAHRLIREFEVDLLDDETPWAPPDPLDGVQLPGPRRQGPWGAIPTGGPQGPPVRHPGDVLVTRSPYRDIVIGGGKIRYVRWWNRWYWKRRAYRV